MFGNDHDTLDVFDATAEFVDDAGIDLPRFAILTPFPGTPLFRRLDSEGRILTRNWELYDGQHVVFQPKLMTPRELQEGHERAWSERLLLRRDLAPAAESRMQMPIAMMANLGYRFYAHHLHTHYNCDWPIGFAAEAGVMRLTLVHPAIGRRPGVNYMRTWQMEPLPIAVLAGADAAAMSTSRFHDDRMEAIPFDEPDRSRGDPGRDLHRQARLPDRQRISAAAACRW